MPDRSRLTARPYGGPWSPGAKLRFNRQNAGGATSKQEGTPM